MRRHLRLPDPDLRPALAACALGVLLGLAAGTFAAEPLWVAAAAFVVVGLAAIAFALGGAHGITVARRVDRRTVTEGDRVEVRVAVAAGWAGRLPTGTISDELLDDPIDLHLGAPQQAVRIRATFARRGRHALAPVRVVVGDPLGLARRTVTSDDAVEVLVLPKVTAVTAPGAEGTDGGDVLRARGGRPRAAAETEIDGLRPHRPGAPASRIHWASWARTGELLERRLVADVDSRALVVLDPRGAEDDDALDAAVRASASLAVHLARAGGCAVLLPGDRRATALDPSLAGWERLHVRLALVTDAAGPSLAGLSGRRGPVLYVAARPVRALPRALADAGGGGRTLVVPGTLAGRRAAFSVAGCTGYELTGSRGLVAA